MKHLLASLAIVASLAAGSALAQGSAGSVPLDFGNLTEEQLDSLASVLGGLPRQ